jgi:Zn-dependent protease
MAKTMMTTILGAAAFIVPMIFAIVFHEVAHGVVARMLGDPTASERGRLSLNPIRHVDLFGTLILPGMLRLAGLPIFGWAKPVPINYNRLRNPKRDMALVGAAGPATNYVFALLSVIAFGLLARQVGLHGIPSPAATFLFSALSNFILFNVFLGTFNLLPIPPFDGSRILRGVLPWRAARAMDRFEPYGIIVFFALFVLLPYFVPGLHLIDRVIVPPVTWLWDHLDTLASVVAGFPISTQNAV